MKKAISIVCIVLVLLLIAGLVTTLVVNAKGTTIQDQFKAWFPKKNNTSETESIYWDLELKNTGLPKEVSLENFGNSKYVSIRNDFVKYIAKDFPQGMTVKYANGEIHTLKSVDEDSEEQSGIYTDTGNLDKFNTVVYKYWDKNADPDHEGWIISRELCCIASNVTDKISIELPITKSGDKYTVYSRFNDEEGCREVFVSDIIDLSEYKDKDLTVKINGIETTLKYYIMSDGEQYIYGWTDGDGLECANAIMYMGTLDENDPISCLLFMSLFGDTCTFEFSI